MVLDNAVIDVSLVGWSSDQAEPQQEVLVAAAMPDQLNRLVDQLKGANLRPFCLSLIPLALKKIYLLNRDRLREESVALIDIGAFSTTIAMVQGEEVVFSREISVGGDSLTEALIDLSRTSHPGGILTYAEAEEIKRRYGIPLDEMDGEKTEEGIPVEALREGLMPIVDRLIMEIDRSFGYFKTQAENQNIDRIFLSGGGSLLKGLPQALERSFNLPMAAYDFWESLEIDRGVDQEAFGAQFPIFIVPLGLAFEDHPAINLLPFKRKSTQQVLWETGKKAATYGLLPLAFFGFLGYQFLGLQGDLDQVNRQIRQRESELSKLVGQSSEMGRLKQQEVELDQKLADYPPRMGARAPVREILGSISRKTLPNMTLTQLILTAEPLQGPSGEGTMPKSEPAVKAPGPSPNSGGREALSWEGNIQLKGTVFGPGEEVLRTLDEFIRALAGLGHFKDVRLEDLKRSEGFKTPAGDFSISVRVQY